MYDILIKNGLIVDGSGKRPFRGNIAVKDGVISNIGEQIEQSANQLIDAKGQVVSPGFIDAHTHDDLVLFSDPYNMPKLMQGVTTVLVGNCGFGLCPYSDDTVASLIGYARPVLGEITPSHVFKDFAAYACALDKLEKGQNIASLIAHGAIYIAENDFKNNSLNSEQIEREKKHVQNAMENGAVGMSVGFMYAPGCYCDANALQPLTEIVAKYNGLYCVHLRSESQFIDDAIQEVLDTVKNSGVAAHISHFKNVGKQYRGNMLHLTEQMEQRIRDGIDITFDMYPYTVGSTTISILFPSYIMTQGVQGCLRLLQDKDIRIKLKEDLKVSWKDADNLGLLCGWENILISSLQNMEKRRFLGRSVAEIADELGIEPEEACIQLFEEEQGNITILNKHMVDSDMWDTILSENCMVISDGIPWGNMPHPRLYGAFPAFLRIFVRENRLLPIEKAIKKITSMPALRFGLGKRGLLQKGYAADIVVFDPDRITDRSTFQEPRQYAKGLSYVMVNGVIVCDHGKLTGKKPGKFLRYEKR